MKRKNKGKKILKHLTTGGINRKIFLSLIVLFIIILGISMLSILHLRGSESELNIQKEELRETIIYEHSKSSRSIGEERVKQKSRDVAKQIEIYLKNHPNISIEQLQDNKSFQSIAVQSLGKQGYTFVENLETDKIILHPSPETEKTSLNEIQKSNPTLWRILSQASERGEGGGYYKWKDPLRNETRRKYLYGKTADLEESNRTRLLVVTTVYSDTFMAPHQVLKSKLASGVESLKSSLTEKIRSTYYLLIAILLALSIGSFSIMLYIGRKVTDPLQKLKRGVQEIGRGNFDTRVDINTGGETEEIAKRINKTAKALKDTERERKELEEAKTNFLSITSHELRSPMTPMKGQLQMLSDKTYGELNEDQKEAVDMVLRNSERLDRIIKDFLDISRVEAARLKFRFRETDLEEHISEVVKQMKKEAKEEDIEINWEATSLPKIECDPDRIMQVLLNLLDNAIKFIEDGGEIKVKAEEKENHIRVSVEDNGPGMTKKQQRKCFEPFYQGEESMYREHRGTGLGLSISKGIINTQGGEIWVESEKGEGSTFYFTVPLEPVKEPKPIKILFAPEKKRMVKIKTIFRETLGPIGKIEFEKLKREGKIKIESLKKYIERLRDEKMLTEPEAEKFEEKIREILKPEKRPKKNKGNKE